MQGNELTIRNIDPDSKWTDKDYVMFHACFTLLCDFVENEYANYDGGFEKYVEWCESLVDTEMGDTNNVEGNRKLLELYEWYTDHDWKEDVRLPDDHCGFDENEQSHKDRLRELIEEMGLLWR